MSIIRQQEDLIMKFVNKLLPLIFFGVTVLYFGAVSIYMTVVFIIAIVNWIKESTFNVIFPISYVLAMGLCALEIIIGLVTGLKLLRNEKLEGLKLFKRIVLAGLLFCAFSTVTATVSLIESIVYNYGASVIAGNIIDIVLFGAASVFGFLAFRSNDVNSQSKLFAIIMFGAASLSVFVGMILGFSFLSIILFSLLGLGGAIMIINKFESEEVAEA